MVMDYFSKLIRKLYGSDKKRLPDAHYVGYRFVEDFTDAQSPGQREILVVGNRQKPKWAVLQCPCGCGHVLNVNLMGSRWPHWRLKFSSNGTLTLWPSLSVRDAMCRSHFFVRENAVIWATESDDTEETKEFCDD